MCANKIVCIYVTSSVHIQMLFAPFFTYLLTQSTRFNVPMTTRLYNYCFVHAPPTRFHYRLTTHCLVTTLWYALHRLGKVNHKFHVLNSFSVRFWLKNLPLLYSHVYVWLQTPCGLVNRFIGHLQVVTKNNYNIIISGVGLSPLGTAANSDLLYKPQMIDEGDCGAIGEMKIGRGNRSTRTKSATAPLCPPQIPHDQTRAWTRATAVGSQWLTAWAMARP
jgi:hypothetical protein